MDNFQGGGATELDEPMVALVTMHERQTTVTIMSVPTEARGVDAKKQMQPV
jgi:hypothetical protein